MGLRGPVTSLFGDRYDVASGALLRLATRRTAKRATIHRLVMRKNRRTRRLIAALVILGVFATAAPYVYVRLRYATPPPPFSFEDLDKRQKDSTGPGRLPSQWVNVRPSSAAYVFVAANNGNQRRVEGRTDIVSATATLNNDRLEHAVIDVDLNSTVNAVPDYDALFRHKVTDDGAFPVATLSLQKTDASFRQRRDRAIVPGTLEIRGIEVPVFFDIATRRTEDAVELSGSVALNWDNWEISNPFSQLNPVGPARLEFILSLVPASQSPT